MRFIKATLFTLLASATAVLAEPACSFTFPAPFEDADKAIQKLEQADTEIIGVTGIPKFLSGHSNAAVVGFAENGETSSYARDIASAARAIYDTCISEDGLHTGGQEYAGGNGNFKVDLQGYDW